MIVSVPPVAAIAVIPLTNVHGVIKKPVPDFGTDDGATLLLADVPQADVEGHEGTDHGALLVVNGRPKVAERCCQEISPLMFLHSTWISSW